MLEAMQQGFDIRQLYRDAQSRWLKPSEVLFILQNHEKFPIAPQPPVKPPSGSLFLFNRRVLRFFRRDGHVWKQKKDGRAVGEAHERLKVGNVDALSCYYAHGKENPYFQRRSYWMLDPGYDHIVLVHYREVVEGRYNVPKSSSNLSLISSLTFNQSTSPGDTHNLQTHDLSSRSPGSFGEVISESIVGINADSDWNDRAESSNRPSQPDVSQALRMLESKLYSDDDDCQISDEENLPPYTTSVTMQSHIHCGGGNPKRNISGNMPSLEECMQHGYNLDRNDQMQGHMHNSMLLQSSGNDQTLQQQSGSESKSLPSWKEMVQELASVNLPNVGIQEEALNPFFSLVHHSSPGRVQAHQHELSTKEMGLSCNVTQEPGSNLELLLSASNRCLLGSDNSIEPPVEAKEHQEVEEVMSTYSERSICDDIPLLLGKENTTEWMNSMHLTDESSACFSNSLGRLFDQSGYVTSLGLDSSLTLAQTQLFSIREVSPEWGFSSENTKVIIVGDFLCNHSENDWKVMFGDTEVPVEIIQNGVLCCHAPAHVAGRVSLCVTSGNRESCSEIREFEYVEKSENPAPKSNLQSPSKMKSTEELVLLTRFAQILLGECYAIASEKERDLSKDGHSREPKTTWAQVIESLLTCDDRLGMMDVLLEELLKDKLKLWISSKCQESAFADRSLSKQEQSIIHTISGLGFEWALSPILNIGVGVNFRDSNGWTALHWAAHFGRENMVAALLAAGASPGAVIDPTAQDPVGKNPASIAAAAGHKGLAGYLSEVALTSHLSSLTLEEFEISKIAAELEAEKAVESIIERNIQVHVHVTEDELSLKDSLAAVRNAAQAAARIQSAFRAHSFRKKQQKAAQIRDEQSMTPQEILELSAASKLLHGHRDQRLHAAALCIQKKYRGWKGRKNFLTLRQHIVKIQAHIRGHQARKKYKEFLWMVSLLEKAILRWRRGGAGLRGFKVEPESIDEVDDNDDDILKVFRKQKVDAAIDEAISRVLCMAESPGARQQYRRMLERYRLAKLQAVQNNASGVASSAQSDCGSRTANAEDTSQWLDERWSQVD